MSATTKTIRVYYVTASYEADGRTVDCSRAEVLGYALGRYYATREEAQDVAIDLQGEVEDTDLDPTTTYEVCEDTIQVRDVQVDSESGEVVCDLRGPSMAAPWLVTSWSVEPRHTTAGVDGWQPAGDSPDAWVDQDVVREYGKDLAISLGREIVALASQS